MKERIRVIALGFFDGVHIGHGALLRRAVQRAKELDAVSAALTFDRPPKAMVGGRAVPLINSGEDRAWLMQTLYGIGEVEVLPFDRAMMELPWERFVTDILRDRFHAVHVVAGHDHHFGYRGEGTPQKLARLCAELGMGCDIIGKVELEGVTVSSTYIRGLLEQGRMEEAVRFLGHPHTLSGTVVHGKQLGRTIGIPTSNLCLPDGVLAPAFGVYATRVATPEGVFPAVTNIGVRPTVDNDGRVTVEPWILDYAGDLYGKTIRVDFYKRLRGERKFSGLEELKAEILRNAEQTRAYFRTLEE